MVVRAESSGDDKQNTQLAPRKPRTSLGEMVNYYLRMEPHLFKEAVNTQFERIREEREATAEAAKEREKNAPPASTDKSELVLYRRMEEVKRNEQRATVEDLMYASVLEKFVEVGVDMMPTLDSITESQETLKSLTEGIHTKEALDLVREHVRGIMGPAAVAFSNAMIKMSKLQAAQVYAASIMFGYFVRRVDKRFQLERSLGLLPQNQEEAVARLERLFSQAEALDGADDPDSPSSSTPSSPDASPQSESSSQSEEGPSFSQAQATGDFQALGAEQAKSKKKRIPLREYVESFDQATMLEMTQVVSAEGAALVEAQTGALFGDLKALQRQMQEAVGTDATSMEELMERVQSAVNSGAVESLAITVGTQRRAVLEAIAFGTFLRDVETFVETEYALLTPPKPSGDFGAGGGGGGGQKVPRVGV
ncbi:g1204 [Coccomyxa viridis]|uniref:G1204 protein n=1 Tax=Coccomyxa viridis TaxID=1274662 RepID=A0ABP1FMW0_9CHLO